MRKDEYDPDDYERHRENMRRRNREASETARDVAESCPECKDVAIRDRCKVDLLFALKTLFPLRFNLDFGPDHLELIEDLQRTIDTGDQAIRAMPRGTGKTSIFLCTVIIAAITGKHLFSLLVGATGTAARELLEQITTELETNEQLLAYFPEIIHPIRCLEGIHQRKLLWNGEPVAQQFKADRIILPSIPGVPGASAIIQTAGLLGRIRGLSFQRPDGVNVRPTLVLIDDPQTDESAVSPKQNEKRERTICDTVPGLAGPGKKTAVLIAVTVKAKDDLADKLLDRTKHPEWHGKRKKLLNSIPTNVDLWNQYVEILRECQRNDELIERATEFYVEHREAMDAGGEASWKDRYPDDMASAIQYAMTLKLTNPSAFASEYQNEPLVAESLAKQTHPDDVVKRLSGCDRGAVPLEAETLVAGVDVQKNYLVYSVGCFSTRGTPYLIDYGTWPDQKTNQFDRRTATRTIEAAFPDGDIDSQMWRALEALEAHLFGNEYKRQDGFRMSLRKIAIDVRYKGTVIKRFIKASKNRDVWQAAQGLAFAVGSAGINERNAAIGEISKHDFRLPPVSAGQIVRTASFDAWEYASKVHDALTSPMGSAGALTLFNAAPHQHRNFADQLCSEYSHTAEAKGRKKRVWQPKPNGGDNDFLDSTKLLFLAGYMSGVEPAYLPRAEKKPTTNNPTRAPRYAAI